MSQPGDTDTQLLFRQQQETMRELQTASKDMTRPAEPKVCAATFIDTTQTLSAMSDPRSKCVGLSPTCRPTTTATNPTTTFKTTPTTAHQPG